MVKKHCKKITNWKAPGWNGVQGFWIKILDTMHGLWPAPLASKPDKDYPVHKDKDDDEDLLAHIGL